eukprot:m.18005 g.18005  ORF g.18005 m.18005 type:complete len:241 (-) comp7645_c0_seq1:263-985(-)
MAKDSCHHDLTFAPGGPDPSKLTCPICYGVLKEAWQGPCQHEFGQSCLQAWLEKSNECPICRQHLDADNLVPARRVRELVGDLVVICEFHDYGCRETSKLSERASDSHECEFRRCPHEECNQVIRKSEYMHHIATQCAATSAHRQRIEGIKAVQLEFDAAVVSNVKEGLLADLVAVTKPLAKKMGRVQALTGKLDAITIPASDQEARDARKALLKRMDAMENGLQALNDALAQLKAASRS